MKFLITCYLAALALLIAVDTAHSEPIRLSTTEAELMNTAYVLGMDLPKPELLQMILLNESVAGRYGPIGDKHLGNWERRSYGVMQVQYKTARFVLKRTYGRHLMNDKDLIFNLTTNDTFSIYVARLYVDYLYKRFNNWDMVLLAYNVGPTNVRRYGKDYDPNNYIKRAIEHLRDTITPFNAPRKRQEMLDNMVIHDVNKIKAKRMPIVYASFHHIQHDLQPYTSVKPLSITNPELRKEYPNDMLAQITTGIFLM